jgi:hypothetical protein
LDTCLLLKQTHKKANTLKTTSTNTLKLRRIAANGFISPYLSPLLSLLSLSLLSTWFKWVMRKKQSTPTLFWNADLEKKSKEK